MKIDLLSNPINWPSEFDIAYDPMSWLKKSKDFYEAAAELNKINEERISALREVSNFSDIGHEIKNGIGEAPIIYLAAFALELAIKAAIISQLPDSEKNPDERVPFNSHSLLELAKKVDGYNCDEESKEEKYLLWASNIIRDGKYPAGIKPSDEESALINPSYSNFCHYTYPIFEYMCKTVHDNKP